MERPTTHRSSRSLIAALAVLALLASLAGCSSRSHTAQSSGAVAADAPAARGEMLAPSTPPAPADAAKSVADGVVAQAANAGGAMVPALPVATRHEIIYTGEMRVEVEDVQAAVRQVEKTVAGAGGWVSNHQFDTDAQGARRAVVEVRIPTAAFGATRDALHAIGDVDHDAVQSQDVGRQLVDLEARLRNLQREESVISALFDRKGKMGEVLEVEHELARVRGEIEAVQGQLRYLNEQVSYSTLSLTLEPKRPAIEHKIASWNLGYHVIRAWKLLATATRMFVTSIIYVTILALPILVLGWATWRALHVFGLRRTRTD